MARKVYQAIASALDAYNSCQKNGNSEWSVKHRENIENIVKTYLPSGSGFDTGTKLDFIRSSPDRLVFSAPYHHMGQSGYYDGWTAHTVTVTPSLVFGFNMKVSGRDRNGFKDYAHDCFDHSLNLEIESGEY